MALGEISMNILIEEKFINNFIVKAKRKRLLYELTSSKKRADVIQKIPSALDDKYLFFSGKIAIEKLNDIFLMQHQTDSYVISDDCDDGKIIDNKQAIKGIIETSGLYITFCDNLVVLKEEYVAGAFSVAVYMKSW